MKFGFKDFTPFLYREKTVEGGYAGTAKAFLITIDPKYKDDEGLFYHELRHVQHWWGLLISCLLWGMLLLPSGMWPFVFVLSPLAYTFAMMNDHLRFLVEVDCYSVQLEHYFHKDERIMLFAEFIAYKYGLGHKYTVDRAYVALKESVEKSRD
jgi:hypothetical protein